MKYSNELRDKLISDPRFPLLGEWKNMESNKEDVIEISERDGHFFIFRYSPNEEAELFPLHYDKENDIFFFFRFGVRVELLSQSDMTFIHIYGGELFYNGEEYKSVEGSFDSLSYHITE